MGQKRSGFYLKQLRRFNSYWTIKIGWMEKILATTFNLFGQLKSKANLICY